MTLQPVTKRLVWALLILCFAVVVLSLALLRAQGNITDLNHSVTRIQKDVDRLTVILPPTSRSPLPPSLSTRP